MRIFPDDAVVSVINNDDATPQTKIPVLKKPVHVTIPFPDTKTAFGPDGKEPLDEFVGVAQKFAQADVFVEGHTDDVGPKETNKKLSLERAQTVADYLVSKNILRTRITVTGYGSERMLHEGPSTTKEQRYENQRVELTLVPPQ